MENDISRILIDTMIRKGIKELQDSPERSIRNLVDMALQFSRGRFQQNFFEIAQNMLKNENSPYYKLIYNTVSTVNTERIVTFGMNIGYNSCTSGAKIIRSIEEKEGFNIPWSLTLAMDGNSFDEHKEDYHRIIQQGESLGIYTWMIFSTGGTENLVELITAHPDSAFILLCSPDEITENLLDDTNDIFNFMLVLQYGDEIDTVCQMLRKKGMLYSLYFQYEEKDLKHILNGELLSDAETLHPVFTGFVPHPDCPEEIQKCVYQFLTECREKQMYQTIPWDAIYDSRLVDSIISDDSCSAGFTPEGFFCSFQGRLTQSQENIFEKPLHDILQILFPKKSPRIS